MEPKTLENPQQQLTSSQKLSSKNLNPQQEKAFESVRSIIELRKKEFKSPPSYDDPLLLRFLRARNFDAYRTSKMLFRYFHWIEDNKISEITLDDEMRKEMYKPRFFWLGRDKMNRATFISYSKVHDPRDRNVDALVRGFTYLMKQMERRLMQSPNPETVTIIVDMKGATLKNQDKELEKKLVDVLQSFYPERLGSCFMIDPPWVLDAAWKVLKHLLDPVTVRKIHFVEKLEELKEYIDVDVIPVEYGGNNKPENFQPYIYYLLDNNTPFDEKEILANKRIATPEYRPDVAATVSAVPEGTIVKDYLDELGASQDQPAEDEDDQYRSVSYIDKEEQPNENGIHTYAEKESEPTKT